MMFKPWKPECGIVCRQCMNSQSNFCKVELNSADGILKNYKLLKEEPSHLFQTYVRIAVEM